MPRIQVIPNPEVENSTIDLCYYCYVNEGYSLDWQAEHPSYDDMNYGCFSCNDLLTENQDGFID